MKGYLSLLLTCLLVVAVKAWDDEISDPDDHLREKRDLSIREKLNNRKLKIATLKQIPYVNITQGYSGQREYIGFLPDLIFILSRRLKFDYEFYEVPDGRYGAVTTVPIPNTNNTKTEWTGAIGELIKNEKDNGTTGAGADIAALPLTITRAREQVVNFVSPFKNLGLTILVKKPHMKKDADQDLWRFEFGIFHPLLPEVWILVSIAVIVVGLVLWGMNMFNPYEWGGRYNLGLATETQAMSFNLPGSLWFVFTTLQWQGFERAPRSMGAKMLTCIWFAFVTLVLVTYTGSLVNHLYWASMVHGTDPTRAPLKDLSDLVTDKTWKYGTIKGGATYKYLTKARGMEYIRMKQYWESEGLDSLVNSTEAGFKKVREEENYAFICESMTAKHEINKQPCDVMTVGADFAARSYGLAVPKNSPILEELHHAILEMGENGDLEMLERRWYVDRGECWNYTVIESMVSKASSLMVDKPKRVSLNMFMGPLVLMVLGVILSILVAAGEIAFYKYKGRYLQSNRPQGQTLKLDPDEGNM